MNWGRGFRVVAFLALCAAAAATATYQPKPYKMGIRAFFPKPTFPADNPLTQEGVALGERLFFETALSETDNISCAHCHIPSESFSDPRRESIGVHRRRGRRNAQPLFNLVWRRNFFWDGRAKTLREQVLQPIADHKEMNLDPEEAAARLGEDPEYSRAFAAAFNEAPSPRTISLALEQFLLTQISQDSRFDKILRGEAKATPQEERGRALFFSEYDPAHGIRGADCFHCHGTAVFTNERFANNGLETRNGDEGRFEVTGKEYDKGLFKVPSLRNVALTGPYMHDGRFRSLREVIEHYSNGMVLTANLDPNLAKHGGQIGLSEADKEALVAFLETLTDESFVDRAKALERKHGFQLPPGPPRGLLDFDSPPPPPPPPPRRR
ncbi:cytochrome-c peroxidase [Candidatus Sumerlaeota bacterium]|nr:cytochrome-c peroxidase [Candidatus Sumerlaeota bacterium]